jgi:glycosyltransferase involved in cell wall biosynthesis
MMATCALLLPSDPFESYAAKFGRIPDQGSLSPAGVFDRVVVAYQATRGGRDAPRAGLTVYRIGAVRAAKPLLARGACFAASLAWFAWRARRIARRERVDLVRAYSPFVPGFIAVLAAHGARRPSIVAVHTDPREVLGRLDRAAAHALSLLARFTLRRADRVWCVTEYIRDAVIALGAPPERVRLAPNRVPIRAFSVREPDREETIRLRHGIPSGAPVVVSVGRLDPEKDPLTIVRAVARLRREDVHLVLVGDGTLTPAIREEATRRGLNGRLTLTGSRPAEEIPSFLHLADCFVMASRYEGFPHALAEALAAGTPVVVSAIPHLDGLLRGTQAVRFPPGDDAALAAGLAGVLADPRAARASVASARRAVAPFDLERIHRAEARLYRELLSRPGAEVTAR